MVKVKFINIETDSSDSWYFGDFWPNLLRTPQVQSNKCFVGFFSDNNLHLVGFETMWSKSEVTLKLASSGIVLVGSC